MAEITIRVGGRLVSMEVSEAEARKVLDELLFQSIKSSSHEVEPIKIEESKDDTCMTMEADVSGSDFCRVPSREEIEVFIRSQPDYRHSVESVAEHFAQKKVSCADGRAAELWLNSIRGYGNRVRESIEKDENGQWISERRGRKKSFRFIKQDESDITNHQGSLFGRTGDESQNLE